MIPNFDRSALLDVARSLPPPPLLGLSHWTAQRDWLRSRLGAIDPERMPRLSDGMRLPGREGRSTPAAVLVPLVNRPGGPTMLLTERSADLPDHPGQISFPGGRRDPEDDSFIATALRESREEIGLDPRHVEVLGEVGRYETVTGYEVVPVVGWVEPPFTLQLDPVEVADAFEVPLRHLLDLRNFERREREVAGRTRHYFACPYGSRFIWGATAAMILVLYYALAVPISSDT